MCGIFAVLGDKKNNASYTVLEGLKKLEYRGYDSWGIAIKPVKSNSLELEKHVGKIGNASTFLPQGQTAIGHTRWATHGGVTDLNAHPHTDCTKTVAVIHNGIVENYQTLKSALALKGHTFVSDTDTEVIAHLIEEEKKTNPLQDAVFNAFGMLVGSNAITVLDGQSETIIACRNGSPLVAGFADKESFLASDTTAFLDATNRVYYLNDNEAIVMTSGFTHVYNLETKKKIKYTVETVNWKTEDAQKGGYPHFLIKEIMDEQNTIPQALSAHYESSITIAEKIKAGYRIVFLGCGSAYYCGLSAHYYYASLGLESTVIGGYEFEPFLNTVGTKTLLFAISQSGETADTLIPVKAAKKQGSVIVAVVNARGSSLERIADLVLPVQAGPEIAVVSTKAFTAQLASLLSVVNKAVDKKPPQDMHEALRTLLGDKTRQKILAVAKRFMEVEHAYVIGKYGNYPAALEFALKLKETSYIHAEAFAAGELKHGVITLVQKGTPCFVMADGSKYFQEIASSASQMKARGGYIVGISPRYTPEFDAWIQTPDMGPEYAAFFNVIVGQLLGYYLGIGRGADPDKPRNLAKSVTVK